ncbi:MAG: hypothetical protein SOW56_06090 [Bacteroidaceae bacterium]|nr:hypothetical protein [Bacteroidaceae bacterium]
MRRNGNIEWRRPDVCAESIFEAGKGQPMRKRCHVNVNRDVNVRVMADGTVRQGKLHRRITANEAKAAKCMSRDEWKREQNGNIVKRSYERPSKELIALANKRAAKFERLYF